MTKKEAVKKELDEISKKNGGMLLPAIIVEYAKNRKTVLHSCFTWDDTEAAQQWRLHQARMLIRVIVTVLPNDDETEFRAFVSLKNDRYSHLGYRPMISVLEDEDLKNQMLEEALVEMIVFKEKYKNLRELVGVFDEMEKIIVTKKVRTRPLNERKDSRVSARA